MKHVRLRFLILLLAFLAAWLWLLKVLHDHRAEPYSEIEEGLYAGAAVPEPPPGTTAVLNLCHQKDRYEVETCLWEPIMDAPPAPDVAWLRRMVEFVDTQRRNGATIYVHCVAGISRSGLVVTAYIMYTRHWGREKALAYVRSRRPWVQPNPAFMQLLSDWEETLGTRTSP
jgi:protein-tyrosine phosphatase